MHLNAQDSNDSHYNDYQEYEFFIYNEVRDIYNKYNKSHKSIKKNYLEQWFSTEWYIYIYIYILLIRHRQLIDNGQFGQFCIKIFIVQKFIFIIYHMYSCLDSE